MAGAVPVMATELPASAADTSPPVLTMPPSAQFLMGASLGPTSYFDVDSSRFTLLVDGVNRGTVDTFATTNRHRVVVWAGRMTTRGAHVVELVNQPTAGRSRIDLDAVLFNEPVPVWSPF
jgi:hypothetical protein